MTKNQQIRKLLEEVIKNGPILTTKQLYELGFNQYYINCLIEEQIIERAKRGHYAFISVDRLFNYGKLLISNKEFEKAYLCLQRCYEIDPENEVICIRLFKKSIFNKDYEKSFEYLYHLLSTDDRYSLQDYKYFLFLLNIITEVPEDLRDYVDGLDKEDIIIMKDDERYDCIYFRNGIRKLVYGIKIPQACKNWHDIIKQASINDNIEDQLLHQALVTQDKYKEDLSRLILRKKYQELIDSLEHKRNKNTITLKEEYYIILARKILEIQRTSQIPKKVVLNEDSIYRTIDNQNYPEALQMAISFMKEKKISIIKNPFYLLLRDICALIDELTIKQKEKSNIISNIITSLQQNDLDSAFRQLREYLQKLNLIQYEFLIVDLIKISLQKQDNSFAQVITTLNSLVNNNYKYNESYYVQEFYLALSQNNIALAKIYLDILAKSESIGYKCSKIDKLSSALEEKEFPPRPLIKSEIIEPEETFNDQKVVPIEPVTKPAAVQTILQPVTPIIPKKDDSKDFVTKKYQELLTYKGVLLLKPTNKERQNRLLQEFSKYPDIRVFTIEFDLSERIVLEYKGELETSYDVKKLIKAARRAYSNGEYNECVDNIKIVLQIVKKPRAFMYSIIGLAFLKKKAIQLAIDYLTIATALSKKYQEYEDFTDLIAKLSNKKLNTEPEEIKPFVRIEDKDFIDNPYYGINNFPQINAYIVANNLDVIKACEELGLTKEQTDIVLLIYARQFFIIGNMKKGNEFLKVAEQREHKTPKVLKILEEVKKNKKLYQHREKTEIEGLKLSLLPKKNIPSE